MAKFFRFPFGTSGDRAAIPDDVDPSGEVSYAQGFGPDYEAELGVDPGAKPVPRPESNQLYFDITDALRSMQLAGVSEWFPASANGGAAISYPVNAIVRHNDLVYRSIAATNTVEPGTDPTKWVVDGVAGQATTATAGLTRYATNPETVARTATDRAVTPAGLGALWALLLNNPVFPEVLGSGLFTLTNPANNVRIAAGTQWVHRGVNTYTSVQTDLPTVASKTYHLRWDPTNGFALYDLSSGSYNPSSVPETDASFDSTYDSMLVARVVTSAGNAATITPLMNKNQMSVRSYASGPASDLSPNWNSEFTGSVLTNWGRTPKIASMVGTVRTSGGSALEFANYFSVRTVSRYSTLGTVNSNWRETFAPAPAGLVGDIQFDLLA